MNTAVRDLDLRRKVKRRAVIKRLMVAGGVAILAVALLIIIYATPVFSVRNIEIEGESILTQQQILDAAQIPLGQPLASVKTKQVKQQIAQLIPVAEVELTRSWPSSVKIKITERQAVFQVSEGQSWVWVDSEGVAFNAGEQLPDVVQATADMQDTQVLKDVAAIVTALPDSLRNQLTKIEAKSDNNIVLDLEAERQVNWGQAKENSEKAQVLQALLKQPALYYDVSSPNNPAIRPN